MDPSTTPAASHPLGMTIPLEGVALRDQQEWIGALAGAGYTDVWSSEASDVDGFTPLAVASQWAPSLRLGTAIVSSFTRGPACLAQSVAALADVAPGRVALGIGSSSNVIVERWNGLRFERPVARTRDLLRFLRRALAGERVSATYDTFAVDGFRLSRPPSQPVPLLVAALRPQMLRLAWSEGDGAILNWLSPGDVARVREELEGARPAEAKEVVVRIFVVPTDDAAHARRVARRAIAAYVNVPVYADFHRWLGRGAELTPMWEAWARGDRAAATAAIPDEVVDDLVVHGTPEQCRAGVDRYLAHGATTPVVALLDTDERSPDAALRLAAAARHLDRDDPTSLVTTS